MEEKKVKPAEVEQTWLDPEAEIVVAGEVKEETQEKAGEEE